MKTAFSAFLTAILAASLALSQTAPSAVPRAKPATVTSKTAAPKTAAPKTATRKSAAASKGPAARPGTASKAASGKTAVRPASSRSAAAAKGRAVKKPVVPAVTWRNRQLAPTPDRYREIQEALAAKGYLKSEPNGVWGPESVDALKQFQAEKSMPANGKINAPSLIGLGLGPRHSAVVGASSLGLPAATEPVSTQPAELTTGTLPPEN